MENNEIGYFTFKDKITLNHYVGRKNNNEKLK